jgi:uncharacterized membrane protein YhaH (DUF805 family)
MKRRYITFSEKISNFFGWIGLILILLAYFLVSYKFILGDSLFYQIINLFGSIFLFYNSCYVKSKPLMALQFAWAVIAIIAIIKIYI